MPRPAHRPVSRRGRHGRRGRHAGPRNPLLALRSRLGRHAGPRRHPVLRHWANKTAIAVILAAMITPVAVLAPTASTSTSAATSPLTPTLAWSRTFPGVSFVESSPTPASLASSAVVMGAQDGRVYALDQHTGANEAGWPVATGFPINSTPATADLRGDGHSEVFVGSGSESRECAGGGVWSFESNGATRWHNLGTDPNCANLAFHSSFTIGDVSGSGSPAATIGGLGLQAFTYSATTGVMNPGWPYYTDDTDFATSALADVSGSGVPAIIMGGDSTPGGPIDHRGGLMRAVNGGGQTIWQFFTDEQMRSSPAVGDIDGKGPSIVFGTGNYWLTHGGANDSTSLFALDLAGHLKWRENLGGVTLGAPALADVAGTGRPDVVEGTAGTPANPNSGTIWVFDGTGRALPNWAGRASDGGVVIGGITTADLNGDGAQDLLVPTGSGIYAYDGRSAKSLFSLDVGKMGFQNSPLVTADGNGVVGITVAGTQPDGTGVVQHWTVAKGASLGAIGWPMFHHDARHTGNLVPPAMSISLCPAQNSAGYWFVARDGGIFSFCGAAFHGSTGGAPLRAPVAAMVSSPSGAGYWLGGADGAVFNYGDAPFLGSTAGVPLARPVVGMARTPSGRGYWLVASDGGIFAFGDAHFFGSTGGQHLNQPIVGMTATATGKGYWLVASDGGIFAFGDARFHGSTGGHHLNQPIVTMARSASGNGYLMVASDGGIFAFGDAGYFGSTGGVHLNRPVVGVAKTPSGKGYWLVASDGGIFSFGDARFLGSTGGITLNQPITAMAVPGG
jgi:ribosomal protein L24E